MESMPQKKDNDSLSQGMGYDLALTRPWSFDDIAHGHSILAHRISPFSQRGRAP
jgi:hypothetical protein